jgi:hypothetical protein
MIQTIQTNLTLKLTPTIQIRTIQTIQTIQMSLKLKLTPTIQNLAIQMIQTIQTSLKLKLTPTIQIRTILTIQSQHLSPGSNVLCNEPLHVRGGRRDHNHSQF